MSDFMNWLYAHYIQPYINSCPMDDGDQLRSGLLETGTEPEQVQDVEAVCRRHACLGFLLGLRTGRGLALPPEEDR